ncbi:unnamed protein product [Coccothraustes coccothraustes]
MLPTTGDAEEGGRQLPVAKRRFRASFGRSRTPERTATCPMLCAQRSRFIASGLQRARKIEKAFCESKVSSQVKQVEELFAMLPVTGEAEEGGRQLPVAKRRFRASFGRSRTPERTATCPMLCAQRSRFIASGLQRAR